MTFIDHFTCITKICANIISSNCNCFSRRQYVPETLMQKNMGILGIDMRIK